MSLTNITMKFQRFILIRKFMKYYSLNSYIVSTHNESNYKSYINNGLVKIDIDYLSKGMLLPKDCYRVTSVLQNDIDLQELNKIICDASLCYKDVSQGRQNSEVNDFVYELK